jgi:CheY-like chemotaxis protein
MKNKVMNVLLVEDNQGDIELIRLAFKEGDLPCDLSVVHDGQEGVDYLYKRGAFENAAVPDIILVDLNMPRMGGKQFLQVIKNDDALKSIPVIMLTSSEDPAEILECYKLHANCYILKPSSMMSLFDLVRQLENFWADTVRLPRAA